MNQSNIFKVSPLEICSDVSSQVGVDGRSSVILEELAFRVHLNLRCDPLNSQMLTAATTALSVPLPMAPNTFHEASDIRIHWLGPDEWLVVAPTTETRLLEKINSAWRGLHHSVTDITGGQTVVRISGERAREVLNQGCTLDLHNSVFRVGCCAQSLLTHVPVLISRSNNNENGLCRFDLIVRRSYASHLARWLIDAAREVGFISRLGNSQPLTSWNKRSQVSTESK